MVAEHEVIDVMVDDKIKQPVHIGRKVFAFQAGQDLDLVMVSRLQAAYGGEIVLCLRKRHAHVRRKG